MNRTERRTLERQQAKAAAALQHRAGRSGSAKEALENAQRLFQLGKGKDALPALRQAVVKYPDDADLRGALGYAMASTGQLVAAIEQYRRILSQQPDAVPVLANLAILLARTGNPEEALLHLGRAAALAPEHANTAFAYADILAKQNRREEAFNQYRRASRLFARKIGATPGIEHCDDLVKLGTAQLWTGDLGPGIRSFDQAVELRPDHALAHARRGMALAKLRRVPEAIVSLKRAADLEPNYSEVRRVLGDVLLSKGDTEKAQQYFTQATRINPNDELSRYFLSAARHETPDAPPPSYVVDLFDSYAHRFEQHLVDVLQYRAPEQVCGALLELAGAGAVGWSVIDLGCGTGLCGPLIRHAAKSLIGVDLSVGMLDKAREKSVYDELKVGDVVKVLGDYADAFDLALCTDVMIYLGNLTPIFTAAGRALKPGALFAFTVEVHSGEGFTLDISGRYLHSRGYVESVAAAHSFEIVHFDSIVARYQNHEPDIHNLFIMKSVR